MARSNGIVDMKWLSSSTITTSMSTTTNDHDNPLSSSSSSSSSPQSLGVLLQDGRVQEYALTTTTKTKTTSTTIDDSNSTVLPPSSSGSKTATKKKSKQQHGTYQLVRESPALYADDSSKDTTTTTADDNDDDETALGLHYFARSRKVCVVSTKGRMSIFDLQQLADHQADHKKNEDNDDDDDSTDDCLTRRDGIVQTFHAFQQQQDKTNHPNNHHVKNGAAGDRSAATTTTLPQRVERLTITAHASNPVDEGFVTVGGKEREMVMFDINNVAVNTSTTSTGQQLLPPPLQPIWKAKNLPPDPQTLLHPLVWPTAACFMSRHTLVVGTAYHQVRIYDVRLSSSSTLSTSTLPRRRPIAYSPFDESLFSHRITALCPQHPTDGHVVYVGDAAGYLSAIDIRMLQGGAILRTKAHQQALVGRYVGPSGSIRAIQYIAGRSSNNSSTGSSSSHRGTAAATLACVGLDRMLRLFDVSTRRQVHAIYLKQRLNCLLVSASPSHDDDDTQQQQQYDSDIDDDDDVTDGGGAVKNVFADQIEDYVGSSSDGDSEDDANPFNDDDEDDGDEDDDDEDSPPKKRRI